MVDYSLATLTKLIECEFEIEITLLQFFRANSIVNHRIFQGDVCRILKIDRFFYPRRVSNFDWSSDTSVIKSIDTVQIPVGPR